MAKLNGSGDVLDVSRNGTSTRTGILISPAGDGYTAEELVRILRELGHVRVCWSDYDPRRATVVKAIHIDLPGGGEFLIQLV